MSNDNKDLKGLCMWRERETNTEGNRVKKSIEILKCSWKNDLKKLIID